MDHPVQPCVWGGGLFVPHPPRPTPIGDLPCGEEAEAQEAQGLVGVGLVTQGLPSWLSPPSLFPGGAETTFRVAGEVGGPAEKGLGVRRRGCPAPAGDYPFGPAGPQAPPWPCGPRRHPPRPTRPPAWSAAAWPGGVRSFCRLRGSVSRGRRPSVLDSGCLCPALWNQPRWG